jgi:glycosyltransferase involved in cell wall biosynthesis
MSEVVYVKPTLHVIGLFHTICNDDFSHCAYTGKVLRFPKMMKMYGYGIIEYSNGDSISEAGEKVQILSEQELDSFIHFKSGSGKEFVGDTANINSKYWDLFDKRVIVELAKRVKDNDIICHTFGCIHPLLVKIFPKQFHVETGIGYNDGDFGCYRIFESYAWMHYHQGMDKRRGSHYEFVVPNYYDLSDWTPRYDDTDYDNNNNINDKNYLVYIGRLSECKGVYDIRDLAERIDEPIYVYGQGNYEEFKHPKLIYKGVLKGRERDSVLRNAKAYVIGSLYVEAFAGAAVEAMLCGTPVIATTYGAFTETVEHGKTGYLCHTMGDMVEAVKRVSTLDRKYIANRARNLYSLETCGYRYDQIFHQISELRQDGIGAKGWYSLTHYLDRPVHTVNSDNNSDDNSDSSLLDQ